VSRPATARLFIAVDPPETVREQLAAWARTALGPIRGERHGAPRPLRVLDAELLHLTLCFLGSRPVEEIPALAAALAECAEPVGELSIGAPLWLPPRRPRALAVEVHDPEGRLARLHASLGEATGEPPGGDGAGDGHGGQRGGGAHPRHRHFRPHITVARMREGAAPRARELAPTPPLGFTPEAVVLYRSWLDAEGALYEPLASATLAPPG
jgi:2'-5' RNA ligase